MELFKEVLNKNKKMIIIYVVIGIITTLKDNSKIALVEKSGAGKSTIIKLIIGLIKPNKGYIKIGKKDLSKLNLDTFYDFVTYVSQDSPIFDGTLKENIVFDKAVEENRIVEVLEMVGLSNLYKKLENRLETQLGEKGIFISGGERQRIVLARLFFDNSKIIILDEATSALDRIIEKKVMKKITDELQEKIMIIISHRLEITKFADDIYVLEDGKIIESGKVWRIIE